MDWTLLGISSTDDKKAITAAYRARLQTTNPEDHPEEFKALRAAYEEALKLAEQPQAAAPRDESPVGLWMERIRALYNDYAARISPEKWRELLVDDVCIALDKRPQAEEALLDFLLEDYYLPQSVWQVLDQTFDLLERREELYEHYAREFVDYVVMEGIRYASTLPYELFVPGISGPDCDAYRKLYYRANQGSMEELPATLEQMDALSERHPYGDALHCRLLVEQGRAEEAREGYRRLAEAYPEDNVLAMAWAAQCMNGGDWEQGEAVTRRVVERSPDYLRAKRALAECLAQLGRLDEAKEQIYDLMNAAGGNQKELYDLSEVLKAWNEQLIQKREARLNEAPEDEENLRELGWCYLQNERDEDAVRICRMLPADGADPYANHNLCAKTFYSRQDFSEALTHLEAVEAILRTLQPDGTDETARRLRKLPEFLQMQGGCLSALKRNAEAMEKYEQALALAPDNPEIVTNMGRMVMMQGDKERAVELFRHLTELLPGAYHGFFFLAMCLFDLLRDREAFEAINRALELERSDFFVYMLKIRILLRNGVWDQVHEMLDFLKQNGLDQELAVAWVEAQLVDLEEKDHDKALDLYYALVRRLEAGEQLDWASQIFYRIVVLLAEKRDCRKAEDRAELLGILDRGLAQDAEDYDCLDYKAWLLKRDGKVDEALELYHKLETFPYHGLAVERELAELYYKNLSVNADKALHYYQILQKREETGENCFYIGTCLRYLGRYEEAARVFLREQELDPDDIDGYKGLSYVYEYMGEYEKTLSLLDKIEEMTTDPKDNSVDYRRVRMLRRLGRVQEALDLTDRMMVKYPDYTFYRLKFEICIQFGLWDAAKAVFPAWEQSKEDVEERIAAEVKLHLLIDDPDGARSVLTKNRSKLGEQARLEAELDIAEVVGDSNRLLQNWKRMNQLKPDDTHVLMNLAEVCWRYSSRADAEAYARMALELLDEEIRKNYRSAAMYCGRRAQVLAYLGRTEEALEELEKVRQMHLCEGCPYSGCKDADLFEASIYEICGEYRKAMELYCKAIKRWPDDIDFIAGIRRLKRRGIGYDDRN